MAKSIEEIQNRLIKLGMREYNAKIYVALFTMGIAKASDLQKLTGVPRGRIYDSLNDLISSGFVVKTNTNPSYYSAVDASMAYYRFHRKFLKKMLDFQDCLDDLQELHPPSHNKTFNVYHSQDAIDQQVQMRLQGAKQDVLVICNNSETLERYSDVIEGASKKIPVYLVLIDKDMADIAPIKCYKTSNTLLCELMQVSYNNGVEYRPYSMYFYFDRESSMGILGPSDGSIYASSIESDVSANFVVKTFMNKIELIKKDKQKK